MFYDKLKTPEVQNHTTGATIAFPGMHAPVLEPENVTLSVICCCCYCQSYGCFVVTVSTFKFE